MIFLPIDIDPVSRVVKRPEHRRSLPGSSEDIYYDTKFGKYCDRPASLDELTYPRFWELYYQDYHRQQLDNDQWVIVNDTLRNEFDEEDGELKEDENVVGADNNYVSDNISISDLPLRVLDAKNRKWRRRASRDAVTRFRFYSLDGDDAEMYALKMILRVQPVRRETLEEIVLAGSFLQYALNSGIMEKEVEARAILETCIRRGFDEQRIRDQAQRLIDGGFLEKDVGDALIMEHLPFIEEQARFRREQDRVTDHAAANVYNLKHMQSPAFYAQSFSNTQRQAFEYLTAIWENKEQVSYHYIPVLYSNVT